MLGDSRQDEAKSLETVESRGVAWVIRNLFNLEDHSNAILC